ncbi:MAG: outer membrane beta-barrel protein [Verrucomicrobia bacterium]|nr:outer membrane beta-barrel protein [Verrucomicrobiota bacterium]
MKLNLWTAGLVAAGVVSLGSVVQAEEASSQLLTALSSTTLSGYVDTSAIWKFGTGNASLPGRQYDGPSKMDGFNLNVVGLSLERPLDEGQWSAGYKVDLLFGPDAQTYRDLISGSPVSGVDGLTIKQAYVALRAPIGNGVDFKVGAFDGVIGYEVFESYVNPNYSRSFGHGLEPKQHVGVLASYQVCEAFSIAAGVANTYHPISPTGSLNARATRANATAAESEKTYLGQITMTLPESLGFLKDGTIYAGVVDGLAGNSKDTTSAYVGATLPTPVSGLACGVAYDYRFNGPSVLTVLPPERSNWAYAVAGYLSWQATEKLKFNGRVDYTNGSNGTWYTSSSSYGGQNELVSYTLTTDYSLWANVISRAELRWDHSLKSDRPYGGVDSPGGDNNAVTLAVNVVYRF